MILVLGSGGLLGSAVMRAVNPHWTGYFKNSPEVVGLNRKQFDVMKPNFIEAQNQIRFLLGEMKPTAVINCIGITHPAPDSEKLLNKVNTLFPVYLADLCDEYGARLIHVSTDCVFAADGCGHHTEVDIPNPDTLYGFSKRDGEPRHSPHLTIRTSFIGLPDPHGRGLLAWLEKNTLSPVEGYASVFWNGLTVDLVARYLFKATLNPAITGLRHLHGAVISKYEVLKLANEVYNWGRRISRNEDIQSNRTLSTIYSDLFKEDEIPPMIEQLKQMSGRQI